jgi:hypothetical protein
VVGVAVVVAVGVVVGVGVGVTVAVVVGVTVAVEMNRHLERQRLLNRLNIINENLCAVLDKKIAIMNEEKKLREQEVGIKALLEEYEEKDS